MPKFTAYKVTLDAQTKEDTWIPDFCSRTVAVSDDDKLGAITAINHAIECAAHEFDTWGGAKKRGDHGIQNLRARAVEIVTALDVIVR